MRDYTPAELDWEYQVEYLKYARTHFPTAFTTRADFQAQYDAAPLMPASHLHGLENATGRVETITECQRIFGHRRDVQRIVDQIIADNYCPPIVLQSVRADGLRRYRLMAGNTRLSVASAMRADILCKVIEVK